MNSKIQEAWKAVQFDHINEVASLVPSVVNQNASTFDPNNHVHTLLMCAAAHGSIQSAKYLLEKGANANLKNFAGFTALHWGAFTGRTETFDLLVEKGAEVESRTEDGRTPLHIAALRGHLEFVEKLLELKGDQKVDINEVACNGWNALHFAVMSNQKAVAKYLISAGIDYKSPDTQKETVWDLARKYKRTWFDSLITDETQQPQE